MSEEVTQGSKSANNSPTKVVLKDIGLNSCHALDNLFHSLTREAGLHIGTDNQLNKLVVEPSIFRRELIQKLRENPENPEHFLQSLQEHIDKELEQFHTCLLPSLSNGTTNFTYNGESLIRSLLSIDFLQPKLIDQLLEKLPEFIPDLDNENVDSPIPRLILQQLKWLEYVVEPDRLATKILEMVSITPLGIQREIITSLPEIVNDSEQKMIITELKDLMVQNHQLMVPILDALSNFSLEEDSISEIREVVVDKLESADLADLPIVVKFLLQTVTPDDVQEVIQKIRRKLDFRTIGKAQNESLNYSKRAGKAKKEQMPEALILESIKIGLQFNKFVKDAWLRAIIDLKTSMDHKIIDILVLIIMHSLSNMKKKVESLFIKKLAGGLFTNQLLEETITCHAEGLLEYFNSILSLSEVLLRTTKQQALIARSACTLYRSSFKVFEAYHRQEIVGSLVTHIGSGSPIEVNSALSVLLYLVEEDSEKMNRFSIFVKGILDYLDNLTVDQIRILFDIFSLLALQDATEDRNGTVSGGGLLSEFSIVVQKQLTSSDEKYKQIGVIGALALIRTLGSKKTIERLEIFSAAKSGKELCSQLMKAATENLDKIHQHCSRSMRCLSLAYDELAYFVSNNCFESFLVSWIQKKMTEGFEDAYLSEHSEIETLKEGNNSIEIWMHMEEMGHDSIYVNIYPLLSAPHVNSHKPRVLENRDWLICLCSMFKLMQACEKSLRGSLDDIGGLLTDGIIMFDKDADDDFGKFTQDTACNSLFIAINWFREVINTFCGDIHEEESRGKIITRLQNVGTMEKMLEEYLPKAPSFQPIGFGTSSKQISAEPRKMILERTDTAQATILKPGRVKRRSAFINRKRKQAPEQNDEVELKRSSDPGSKLLTLADLRPLMRELDWSLFAIIEYGNVKPKEQQVDDSQETDIKNTRSDPNGKNIILDSEAPKLGVNEMIYLLEDLDRKLEFKLASNNIPFFSKKLKKFENGPCFSLISRQSALEVINQIIILIPRILKQFEAIIKAMEPDDDMVLDDQKDIDNINRCSELLLKVIHRVISWPDLTSPDNENFLKNLLEQIRSPNDHNYVQHESLEEASISAFNYLEGFAGNMPNGKIAILFHQILNKIAEITPNCTSLISKSGLLARKFASCQWDDVKQLGSQSIIYLVQQDIKNSDDKLDRIEHYLKEYFVALAAGNDEILEEIPLLSKNTYPDFCKALSIELVECLSEHRFLSLKSTEETLIYFAKSVRCWKELVSVILCNQHRSILASVLRYGRGFIDLFLKNVLPFLDEHLKSHQDNIMSIFKHFQSATRHLQALCNHVKVAKNLLLSNMVPALKKSLEIVIFQVKAMLQHNGFSADSFFMGNLKHRDLEGNAVSSDIPADRDSAEEDQDHENIEETEDEEKEEYFENETEISSQHTRSKSPTPSSSKRKRSNGKSSKSFLAQYSDEDMPDIVDEEISKKMDLDEEDVSHEEEIDELINELVQEVDSDNSPKSPKDSITNESDNETAESSETKRQKSASSTKIVYAKRTGIKKNKGKRNPKQEIINN
ncbi:hypothetical protein G9A89_008117 [Geosiphon pyriformis]|nr:hypothetical protein G9A89_008117 [Geosiphon pyriformis]